MKIKNMREVIGALTQARIQLTAAKEFLRADSGGYEAKVAQARSDNMSHPAILELMKMVDILNEKSCRAGEIASDVEQLRTFIANACSQDHS